MEWLERLNKSIEYLEENICGEISIEEAAGIACLSKFHFQRMFHIVTGVTIAEYVRKRRLTLAAQELITTDTRVIDVALKYGYSSPESFSRAFSRLHGISPSNISNTGEELRAYPQLSFQIKLKGAERVNYKIIEKDAFKIIGRGIRVSAEDGENFKQIPKFWDECYKDGTCDKLFNHMGELGLLGVCMETNEEQDEFTYLIAIEKSGTDLSDGFIEKEVPGSTWAVFEAIGPMPDAIQEVWKQIYSEWFPSTRYKHAGTAELEIYYPGDPRDKNYRSEVWIPIIKE